MEEYVLYYDFVEKSISNDDTQETSAPTFIKSFKTLKEAQEYVDLPTSGIPSSMIPYLFIRKEDVVGG